MTPETAENVMRCDETARLVLMEMRDARQMQSDTRLHTFAEKLREVESGVNTATIAALWSKYMGFDYRSSPTHDYETGRRL